MPHHQANGESDKLSTPQREIDLVQFMLEVAAEANPDVDRVGCLLEIDRLSVACHDRIDPHSCIDQQLAVISRQLFEVEGFHGNRDAYYEPENSYLNEVLARRRGIPISLGILYIAVAGRAGVKMFGVNTPGHFVVGCCAGGRPLFVDPFNGGDILDQQACKCRIEHMVGTKDVVCCDHFRAAAPLDIAARVLRNLKAAHAMEQHWTHVLRVQQRLVALLPHVPQERRDLGLVYLRLGKPHQALGELEPYLKTCGSQQAAALEGSIRAARRMVCESN